MKDLDDFLKLPPHKRRLVDLTKKRGRNKPSKRKKVDFTRDELIDYIVKNKIKSVRMLYSFRQHEDPHINNYRKVFGSWQNAKDIAFGKKKEGFVKITPEYIIKIILQFDVWKVLDYKELRKKRPDIIPPYHKIMFHFGNFRNLKIISAAHSVRLICEEYLKLKRTLGKEPTIEDCEERNINVIKAHRSFGGKPYFLNFMKRLERHHKNRFESKLGEIGLG